MIATPSSLRLNNDPQRVMMIRHRSRSTCAPQRKHSEIKQPAWHDALADVCLGFHNLTKRVLKWPSFGKKEVEIK